MTISSRSKTTDNQGHELLQLVDETIIDIEVHVEGEPSITTNQWSAHV